MRLRRLAPVVALLAAASLVGLGPARGVINGEAAEEGEFPFMASLQDSTGFAFCGGSVIAKDWILTAAHCVQDLANQRDPSKPIDLQIVTGRTNLSDTSKGQVLGVSAVYVHPDYDDAELKFDAALVRLASPTVSPAITRAALADDDLEADGTLVTVAGWGDQLPTLGLFSTNQLQSTDLKVVSDTRCAETNLGFDAPTGVCAEELLTDSCNGDSGGPLWGVKNGTRIQIGIVSYGTSCAVPRFPGVYSEVNNPGIASFINTTTSGGGPSSSSTTTTKKPHPRK